MSNESRHQSLSNSAAQPYPKIKVVQQNKYYGVLLLEDYAGAISELTAISQFIHHHIVFRDEY
ncbi:hypothetical protein [Dendrosporobacter sp. 1207_IL3150]|uniref:hypothetical protein n=1 Tax=Dendrosporobacter sp. 1207_IL3150 TaxID=3084054 RepID=UPI002FDA3A1D